MKEALLFSALISPTEAHCLQEKLVNSY